ncbi:MAG: glycosyltransferase family 9 protein [Desulfovibrionales bacterium]|nr:glycosyltransferase family 9 protein [Desulfovibrionales bacterium]
MATLNIPGVCFLTSSVPLEFDTDGCTTSIQPSAHHDFDPERVLVLTDVHVELFGLRSIPGVSLYNSIGDPENIKFPQLYDGTQDLGGKRVLILMLNGWGDMILIQPALRALYKKTIAKGDSPYITLGCNWIRNFPYPGAPYVTDLRPNILSLRELSTFDFLVNFIPVNYQRSHDKSMKDSCLEILKLDSHERIDLPYIRPDAVRVEKVKPVLDQIRKETGKKLLCLNWKSRFQHKNASPVLFARIASKLQDRYQALLIKDKEVSRLMQKEIDASSAPIINLSHLVHDYHDTVAALSLIDAFISVDTGIVHAAGAMGIPGIALFGPFPPETHVADYPSVVGIRATYEGKTCKGPCLETHRGCAEVDFTPTEVSPCFEALRPDEVVEAFNKQLTVVR